MERRFQLTMGMRKLIVEIVLNRLFLNCKKPYFQSEDRCTIFHMKMNFVCIRMKTRFHTREFALSLALKRRFGQLESDL